MNRYSRADWNRIALLLGVLVALLAAYAMRAEASTVQVRIPSTSVQYRFAIEQAAGERFGLNAPVARLAAQLQQESGWNPKAKSPYAQGLAQFTPPTAKWIPQICPSIGKPDPWDAGWSIRAQACYDAWLHARAPGADACQRWAMTLSAYNGGETMRDRERRLSAAAGKNPDWWFDETDAFRARGTAAWRENRAYVRRILLTLEPAYINAGWSGTAVCA